MEYANKFFVFLKFLVWVNNFKGLLFNRKREVNTFQVSSKSGMARDREWGVRVDSLLGNWPLGFCDRHHGDVGAILESFLGLMPF